MEPSSSQAEPNIEKFFNSESKSMLDRHETKGVPDTAIKQVMDILDSGSENVIDVGSGPGSVMLEFLKNGMPKVTGVDLSPDMNSIARDRIKESGFTEEQYELIQGSFLQFEPAEYDAVSLHRVLCCHPDKEGMLNKCTEMNPKVISLTVPRTWLFLRLFWGIVGLIAKITNHFRPYVHSQKYIDKELEKKGYKLISRKKTLAWVQSTYQKH